MESSGSVLARTRTAILNPCYNEELTVADVINKFRAKLPDAVIYVFDNNSADRAAEEAERAGAIVLPVRQ